MTMEKFLAPLIDFIDKNFGREPHKYVFITSPRYEYNLTKEHDIEFLYSDDDIFITLLNYMKESKKIILHGLKRDKINKIFFQNRYLLKKSFWIMWGGDFYFPEKQNKLQKFVIEEISYLVTGTIGEVEYVRDHYNAKGIHIKAFVYISNMYKDIEILPRSDNTIKILVGNSSTKTNHHIEVFNILKKYKDKNIEIIVPLSYGDFKYGMKVMEYGYTNFGLKFKPLLDFMSEKEYNNLLSAIDIGIFNHNRQQGMGNIITLLGLGKKVFMNSNVTTYKMFKNNNIEIFNIENFNIEPINLTNNRKLIRNIFSEDNFVKELNNLFNYEIY